MSGQVAGICFDWAPEEAVDPDLINHHRRQSDDEPPE
ncbi:MAG: hypothetical protein K0S79_2269, partial [Nitrospira sp.]|nr:hypothetical protein [Nitrospira sp.]